MAMVDMKDLLQHAYQNRYAVGAFEVVSLDFLQAVIDAAERARSPVIINIVETHFGMFDVETLMAAVVQSAKRTSVPVCVQLDHCTSAKTIKNGMRLGCNSVMYDGSHLSFPVNVQHSKDVAELVHSCGVAIEGEIGVVAGIQQVEAGEDRKSSLTSVSEAGAYVERTDVDFLAIAVGNEHGKAATRVKLDFTRLARINDAVRKPLVIHGGSGLTDDQYHKLIDHGVAKINYFTALAERACSQVKANLKQKNNDYQKIFRQVRQRVSEEVQRCMQVWGSAGRAAELFLQCRPWRNVEHVVGFESNEKDPRAFEILLAGTRQQLVGIPGVLDVQLGQSVSLDDQRHYFWLLRLASEKVLSNYLPAIKKTVFEHHQDKLNYKVIIDGDFNIHEAGTTLIRDAGINWQ